VKERKLRVKEAALPEQYDFTAETPQGQTVIFLVSLLCLIMGLALFAVALDQVN